MMINKAFYITNNVIEKRIHIFGDFQMLMVVLDWKCHVVCLQSHSFKIMCQQVTFRWYKSYMINYEFDSSNIYDVLLFSVSDYFHQLNVFFSCIPGGISNRETIMSTMTANNVCIKTFISMTLDFDSTDVTVIPILFEIHLQKYNIILLIKALTIQKISRRAFANDKILFFFVHFWFYFPFHSNDIYMWFMILKLRLYEIPASSFQ